MQQAAQTAMTNSCRKYEREKKETYNHPSFFNLLRKLRILGQEAVAWVDHVNIMLKGNLDNLISGKIGPDGRVLAAASDNICLICLLAMHAKTVLIAVDGDGVQGELVSGTEDTNGDFSTVGNYYQAVSRAQGSIEGGRVVNGPSWGRDMEGEDGDNERR